MPAPRHDPAWLAKCYRRSQRLTVPYWRQKWASEAITMENYRRYVREKLRIQWQRMIAEGQRAPIEDKGRCKEEYARFLITRWIFLDKQIKRKRREDKNLKEAESHRFTKGTLRRIAKGQDPEVLYPPWDIIRMGIHYVNNPKNLRPRLAPRIPSHDTCNSLPPRPPRIPCDNQYKSLPPSPPIIPPAEPPPPATVRLDPTHPTRNYSNALFAYFIARIFCRVLKSLKCDKISGAFWNSVKTFPLHYRSAITTPVEPCWTNLIRLDAMYSTDSRSTHISALVVKHTFDAKPRRSGLNQYVTGIFKQHAPLPGKEIIERQVRYLLDIENSPFSAFDLVKDYPALTHQIMNLILESVLDRCISVEGMLRSGYALSYWPCEILRLNIEGNGHDSNGNPMQLLLDQCLDCYLERFPHQLKLSTFRTVLDYHLCFFGLASFEKMLLRIIYAVIEAPDAASRPVNPHLIHALHFLGNTINPNFSLSPLSI